MTGMDNCQIISVANQKGGVGKTTTAINLATAFAAANKKVLVVDLDPQGNASTGLGVEDRGNDIYKVLSGEQEIKDVIQDAAIPGLFVIPSSVDLSAAEVELVNEFSRESILKDNLDKIKDDFDFIFIDCPPSLGLLTINAFVASNSVMIPLQCEFFALEGLSHLLRTINRIQKRLNPDLEIHGVVLTMHDKRNNLTQQVELDVRQFLGDTVFKTVIPRNVKMSEASSYGQPAVLYDHRCNGSMAYIHLAKEILKKDQQPMAA